MALIKAKISQPINYTSPIAAKITQRRWQILVHSYIYYEVNKSIVADSDFDKWSQELVKLQQDYPGIASKCIYAEAFKDFEGSSGFDLPYTREDVVSKAMFQLKLYGLEEDYEHEESNNERHIEQPRETPSKTTRRSLPS